MKLECYNCKREYPIHLQIKRINEGAQEFIRVECPKCGGITNCTLETFKRNERIKKINKLLKINP